MNTADNVGNMTLCVHSYTSEILDIHNGQYKNGYMSRKLLEKINKKEYNKIDKKDYYFIVINKFDSNDVIINSVKGLSKLTPNINNLPFQIKWNDNRDYNNTFIKDKIKMLIECFQRPQQNWKEHFLENIKKVKVIDI